MSKSRTKRKILNIMPDARGKTWSYVQALAARVSSSSRANDVENKFQTLMEEKDSQGLKRLLKRSSVSGSHEEHRELIMAMLYMSALEG